VCVKPLVCVASNSSTPTTNLKTCQCRLPFKDQNGVCLLECKPNEVFENGECKERCKNDESKNTKNMCKKMGNLGQPCDDKNQCLTPFAVCLAGKCTCGTGFTPNAKRDSCDSAVHWCPIGQAASDRGGQIVQCKVTRKSTLSTSDVALRFPPIGTPPLTDNCAADQFCMLSTSYYTEDAVGHCCPKPKLSCPVGVPHPNATCGRPILFADFASNSNAPYCPFTTHSCIDFKFGGGFELALCCPIACTTQQISIDGKCLPKRNYGDNCENNDQCKDHSGICDQGTCKCGKDQTVEGSGEYKYCRQVCKPNEVQFGNNQCLPRLKLGQQCDQQFQNQCPLNSFCNEKRICDCYCGFVKLDDDSCAPQPTCPQIEPVHDPLAQFSLKVKEFVLCQVVKSDSKISSGAAVECPSGQYCSRYNDQYGVCCPKPTKPFCPNGATPGSKCNPNENNKCGPSAYCNRYMFPANDDGTSDNICCPLQETKETLTLP